MSTSLWVLAGVAVAFAVSFVLDRARLEGPARWIRFAANVSVRLLLAVLLASIAWDLAQTHDAWRIVVAVVLGLAAAVFFVFVVLVVWITATRPEARQWDS